MSHGSDHADSQLSLHWVVEDDCGVELLLLVWVVVSEHYLEFDGLEEVSLLSFLESLFHCGVDLHVGEFGHAL